MVKTKNHWIQTTYRGITNMFSLFLCGIFGPKIRCKLFNCGSTKYQILQEYIWYTYTNLWTTVKFGFYHKKSVKKTKKTEHVTWCWGTKDYLWQKWHAIAQQHIVKIATFRLNWPQGQFSKKVTTINFPTVHCEELDQSYFSSSLVLLPFYFLLLMFSIAY